MVTTVMLNNNADVMLTPIAIINIRFTRENKYFIIYMGILCNWQCQLSWVTKQEVDQWGVFGDKLYVAVSAVTLACSGEYHQ